MDFSLWKKDWQDLREMNVSNSDETLPTLKREWVASCHFSLANCIIVNLLVFISQNERERKGQAPFHNTQIVDIKPPVPSQRKRSVHTGVIWIERTLMYQNSFILDGMCLLVSLAKYFQNSGQIL
jgi:hypothetical protein